MPLSDYSQLYADAGAQYRVDPNLLMAQGMQEDASGDPNATGPDTPYGNARGPAQLIPPTAKALGVTDPTDPKQAIFGQAKLMRENLDRSKEDTHKALLTYHGGTNEKNWGPKTHDYAGKVMNNYQKLSQGGTQVAANTEIDPLEMRVKEGADTSIASPAEDPLEMRVKQGDIKTKPEDPNATKDLGTVGNFGAGAIKGIGTAAGAVTHAYNKYTDLFHDAPQPHPLEQLGQEAGKQFNKIYQPINENNPKATTLGDVSGQVLATAPILGAAGETLSAGANALRGVPYVGKAAQFLTGGIENNIIKNAAGEVITPATTANIAARVAQTVPTSAAQLGGFNALTGQDPVHGAEIGAAVGPLGYMVGKGLGWAANKLTGQGQAVPREISLLAERFKEDGVPPEEIANKIAAMGPNASMADAGGQNVRDLAKVVANVGGPGKEKIANFLEERQMGQVDRLREAAMSNLGVTSDQGYEHTYEGLHEAQQAAAAPHYEEAYKANQSMASPEINAVLRTPAGKTALKNAVTTMQNGRSLVGVSNPDLVEQAALTGAEPTGDGIAAGLKLKTLDQVKQELWDLGEAARNPRTGEATTQSNAIHDLRRTLKNELDNLDSTAVRDANGKITTPGRYAQGRAAFANPADQKDALEAGWDFVEKGIRGNTDPKAFEKLTDAQKPYARIGAANKVLQIIQTNPDGANTVNKLFNTEAKRATLRSIFPSEEALKNFENTLAAEKSMNRTYGEAMTGSRTTPLAQAIQNTAQPTRLSSIASAMANSGASLGNVVGAVTGHPLPLAVDVGKTLLGKAVTPKATSPETFNKLADIFVTPENVGPAINRLTPAANPVLNASHGREHLLLNYMNGLATRAGYLGNGNSLTQPQQ